MAALFLLYKKAAAVIVAARNTALPLFKTDVAVVVLAFRRSLNIRNVGSGPGDMAVEGCSLEKVRAW